MSAGVNAPGAGRCGGRPGRAWALGAGLCAALAAYACWGRREPAPGPEARGAVGVLLWWAPFGGLGRGPRGRLRGAAVAGAGPGSRACAVRGCRLLTERAAYGEARAVLFHHHELARAPPDWPPPWGAPARAAGEPGRRGAGEAGARPPGQRWVWMNFESPTHTAGLRRLAGGLFNWTLSYRADSDVFVPYGYLYPRRHPRDAPPGPAPPLAQKRGLVAWVVSNWSEDQERVAFFRELSQHLPVDVFGGAPRGRPLRGALVRTVARYKFYLALENSRHPDYITEKLWRNALLAGAVPVVLGPERANYERFVPRGAFIHVNDFPTAAALAAHLLFLDRHPAAYLRYFSWRRSFAVHVTSFWDEPWCRVCQVVQRAGDQPKSIPNLAGWFQR
ncbi:alpha-(1,3)-fucosyltransferase 4-like [Dasypus novemcinctus]|uniref:alpha-(1,3)-fucosyltransferase 4-like n=1 Tax=Dasypus novemcinctus TaxID=9361 RepID=UPI00265ECB0C|nr:alpha-(1,3)-fucosyltransferase 4-like [Dasypus novemcinctus]